MGPVATTTTEIRIAQPIRSARSHARVGGGGRGCVLTLGSIFLPSRPERHPAGLDRGAFAAAGLFDGADREGDRCPVPCIVFTGPICAAPGMPGAARQHARGGLKILYPPEYRWGGRPNREEKHAKEPDFSRRSSASLWVRQCCREDSGFAACNYCGQLGLAGMLVLLLANCTQQLAGLTPGITLRATRQLPWANYRDWLAQVNFV
jgi:hypothetical protein